MTFFLTNLTSQTQAQLALADALKSLAHKPVEASESLDQAAAAALLKSGKMEQFRDFKLLKKTDKIKILTVEYFELSAVVATLDNIDNSTDELTPIAPGVPLYREESKLKNKGFGWEALQNAF